MVKKYARYTIPLKPYWDYSNRMPLDGKPFDYDKQLLIRFAYAPICDLALTDYFENGFVHYPFLVPVIDNSLNEIGSFRICNDRQYFDFCENNKDAVLKRYKTLFREE